MSTEGVFIALSDKFTISFDSGNDFELENGECTIVYVLLISVNVQSTPGSDADEGFKISDKGLGFIHANVCSVRAKIDMIPISLLFENTNNLNCYPQCWSDCTDNSTHLSMSLNRRLSFF